MHLQDSTHDYVVVASEENQPCYAYDLNNGYARITVWSNVGGTMTMVQVPGTLDFLATQRFYPGFNSAKCRIVKETFNGKNWDQTFVGDFPYIHRFDLVSKPNGKGYWYIGCSIADSKKNADDWSRPGKIWVGDYSDENAKIYNQKALDIRITKNHGYKRMDGYSFITGVEGIFKLYHPVDGNNWRVEHVSNIETSDIENADINGDGKDEYLTIEGFHGPYLRISDNQFHSLIRSEADTPFGHAIWGGKLPDDKEYFIFGWRSGKQDLKLITNENFDSQLIDKKVGPSNLLVFEKGDQQYLFTANRESNEIAVYAIKTGE